MFEPLILYDIPNKHDGQLRAWSPNTWKTRFVLNYKRIPYRTVWVEYPDIEPLCKAIGAAPTAGGGYTLPVLRDPNTGVVVSDSWAIAKHLDAHFPERIVITPGTDGLQHAFQALVWNTIHKDLFALIVLGICTSLRPRSQEYFRRTREDDGRTLEEYAPPGFARAEKLARVEAGFTTLARCYAKAGPWLSGNAPTYGDFVAGAWLLWASRALDKEEWEAVMKYDEGLWRRLLDDLEEYMSVDEGETYVVEAK